MSDTRNEMKTSIFYTAMQVAGAVCVLNRYICRRVHGEELLVAEDLVVVLEQVLSRPRAELEKILNIFVSAKLFKAEVRKDVDGPVLLRDSLLVLDGFHQFLTDAKSGRIKRTVDIRLSQRDIRVLAAVVKHTRQLYVKTDQVLEVPVTSLEEELEDKTLIKFELEALEEAAAYGLIKLEGRGESAKIFFNPEKLERILRYAEAIRKISALEEHEAETAA